MKNDIFNSDDTHKRLSMKVNKDTFYEISVYSTNSSSNILYTLYMICSVSMGILAFCSLFFGGFTNIFMYVIAAVCGMSCYFFYHLAQNTRVEYDYTFTNGTLDIAKIINDKTRKKLLSLNVAEILDMQPITASAFQSYFEDKSIKRVNMFINRGEHLYYMLFVKDGAKIAVVFEPDQQMIEYIKMYNTNNVIA